MKGRKNNAANELERSRRLQENIDVPPQTNLITPQNQQLSREQEPTVYSDERVLDEAFSEKNNA